MGCWQEGDITYGSGRAPSKKSSRRNIAAVAHYSLRIHCSRSEWNQTFIDHWLPASKTVRIRGRESNRHGVDALVDSMKQEFPD
jgi:hypothetical protein